MTRRFQVILLAILTSCVPATTAIAQVAQAELRGTVVDESGAALPGVTVTATHVDTGVPRTTVSSSTGVFTMPALLVGRYRLQLDLTGFSTVVQEGLVLSVGQSAAVTMTMKVTTVEETVAINSSYRRRTA